ncbi:transcriptional repressor [Sulfurovum sp. bin170]|uniref:Fur family transcriptional regulator n=1 Tax=Sulfurovum sp. bin170 TaxID=2695268 RepID=UPI0013E022A8|nr:Fur family transcriptional regulator [Sulfurovum sp. bin170]NEW60020.1 transcriptional repressor [Sulfurovum sp. bin170]
MPKNIVSYDEVLINFKKLLKSNTLKYTKQRELILEIIYNNNGHFTPEDIYNLIKESYPDVKLGIATVYRTLTLLEDASIVSSISFGAQGKKYEFGLKDHHDHLVCLECGAIEEFIDEVIEKRQEDIAKQFNFKMTNHIMKITGTCSACQAKE